MNINQLKSQVKGLIHNDKIDKALETLTKYLSDSDKLDEITLLSGRYHSLMKDKHGGTGDFSEVHRSINKLRQSILKFVDSVAEEEEEEEKFKSQVFDQEKNENDSDLIPVFFSVGTPHIQKQLEYINELKSHIKKYNINLIALDDDDWNTLDPLEPIKNKMLKCSGSLILAMERYHVKYGENKRGSLQESKIENQNYATSWTHIESTMAYLLDHPFIILKEDNLKSEGMLDDQLFEWRIVKINTNNPGELAEYPLKQFIRMWVEEIKKNGSK